MSLTYGLLYAVLFVAIPYFITRALANRVAGVSGHTPGSAATRPL